MILECPICVMSFEGEILHDYISENPHDWVEAYKYTLSKCPKCESPIFLEQEREVDFDIVYWGTPKTLYPQIDFHINPVIPDKIRESLLESIQCYKAKSYTATTIMCRRVIEGFCITKGVKGRDLKSSIEKLKKEGIINEQLYEWANELRLLGNEAAHNIDVKFSATDARDTLDFTIAILDFSYSFKDKFEKFKQRMQTNRNTQQGEA